MDEMSLRENKLQKEDEKPQWQRIKSKWDPIVGIRYPFLFVSLLAVIFFTVVTVWGIRKAVYSDRLSNFRANADKMTDVMEFSVLKNRYAAVPETLGIANTNLKQTIMGRRSPDNGDLVTLLSDIRAINNASLLYVMNKEGTVVGSTLYDGGKSLVGNNYAFRPYFKEAIKGKNCLYAALGITTKKRGLYYVSPVYGSLEKSGQSSDIIGAIALKMGLSAVDGWLNGLKGPAALVTSRGVIFASNRKGWMFQATKTHTIVDSMQFSNKDRADLKYLDVNLNGRFVDLDGKIFALARNMLNLKDEFGKWELVWLQDTANWFPLWNMALCSVMVALFYFLLGVFFLHRMLRKRAEEGLRESEENYRSIFDSANDALFIHHMDTGEILSVNRKMCEMYGYSKEEALNLNIGDISEGIPPYSQDDAFEWVQKAVAGDPQIFEWRARDRAGRAFWVEVNLKRAVIGGEKCLLAIVREITSRKRAEQTLARNLESMKLGESLAGLGYFERNWQNGEGFWSEGFYKLLGETPDGLDCTHAEFMKYVHPDDVKRVETHIRETLEKQTQMDIEFRLVQAVGKIIDIHGKGRNSYDDSGKPRNTIGTFLDITKRKKAELALRESEEKLARSKKMESLGLMAGGIAHDLNNILSGIVTYPELLLMDLPEDSPLKRPIKTIQEAGMRAVDVVADLLTIARGVATGKEVLNLNVIVSEYMKSPEWKELEKTHPFMALNTELDPGLLNVSGSPTHIKKTLMNLITNASEAIEKKGRITVSTRNRYLDEPLKGYENVRQGEYVLVSVSDEGSGITPEDLERIFEPFYTKKVMGRSGTGLGLAVVWSTVQDHNGYINVKSNEKGTVFDLYFPVTREKVAAKGEEAPLEDYLGQGEKILVVDDEERQREIAGALLTKLGYVTEAVSSGEDAIGYLMKHSMDLIVLDMVMPKGINGRETYEKIIKIHPAQKAIIASGYAKTKEVAMVQELGAGKYIKKPYTLEKIGLAVKEELEK